MERELQREIARRCRVRRRCRLARHPGRIRWRSTRSPRRRRSSPYAQAYGWEQGNAARLADSGIDYPYAPTPVSLVEPIVEPARQDAPSPPPSLAPWPPGQVSIHPEIERYTDYPIERKDADTEAPDEELAAPVEAGK